MPYRAGRSERAGDQTQVPLEFARGLVLLVSLAISSPAQADEEVVQPPRPRTDTQAARACMAFELRYSAPEDCPDAQYLCDRLLERRSDSIEAGPGYLVRVTVERDDFGYQGVFEVDSDADGVQGRRTLRVSAAEGCPALLRGVASALTNLTTPLWSSGEEEVEAVRGPVEPVDDEPEEVASPLLASTWSGAWSAGVALSYGWAPAVTWGPRLGLALNPGGAWSFGLDARVDTSLSPGQVRTGVSVDTTILSASPSACVHRGRVFFCGDLVLGLYRSTAEGLEDVRVATDFMLAPGLRAGWVQPLSSLLRVILALDLHVPLVAIELTAGETLLWRSAAINGGLTLSVSGDLF